MRFPGPLVVLSIAAGLGVLTGCSSNVALGGSGGGSGTDSSSSGGTDTSSGGCYQPDYACTCTCNGQAMIVEVGNAPECFVQGLQCADAGAANAEGGDSGAEAVDGGDAGSVPVYESCVLNVVGCG